MAKTIAQGWGNDRARQKYCHRLGSVSSECRVATWYTEIRTTIYADGSGMVAAYRGKDGRRLSEYTSEDNKVLLIMFGIPAEDTSIVNRQNFQATGDRLSAISGPWLDGTIPWGDEQIDDERYQGEDVVPF